MNTQRRCLSPSWCPIPSLPVRLGPFGEVLGDVLQHGSALQQLGPQTRPPTETRPVLPDTERCATEMRVRGLPGRVWVFPVGPSNRVLGHGAGGGGTR